MNLRFLITPVAIAAFVLFPPPAKGADGVDPAAVAGAVKSVVVVLPTWRNVRPASPPARPMGG